MTPAWITITLGLAVLAEIIATAWILRSEDTFEARHPEAPYGDLGADRKW